MKKTGKLKLHRETLRILAEPGLRRVAGGSGDTTQNCEAWSTCACPSEEGFCDGSSRHHTCGTVCDIPSWHC
jgi:hypothetical protein